MLASLYSISYTLLAFALIISIVVFIHEFGHYIVARLSGVHVETFSIGFGPRIFGFKDKNNTDWRLSAIPLGGYVKMFGDADPTSKTDVKALNSLSEEDKQKTLFYKPLSKRFAIVFAGPLFNFLLAITILAFMAFSYGVLDISTEVGGVSPDSPAEKAGIKAKDVIVELDGKPISSFQQLRSYISLNTGAPVELGIMREGERINVELTPQILKVKDGIGTEVNLPTLGIISSKPKLIELNLWQSLSYGVSQSVSLSASMLKAIGQLITGERGTEELGGPIKIAQYSGHTVKQGLKSALWFIALISLNLGLVNLFPIPALDGGHLVIYTLEGIRGKTLPPKIYEGIFRVGFAFLLALMLFVTFNDIKVFFK